MVRESGDHADSGGKEAELHGKERQASMEIAAEGARLRLALL